MRRLYDLLIRTLLTLALGVATLGVAHAQQGSSSERASQFNFGPPLRDNIVFSYEYTERVRTWIADPSGALRDSSERMLIYYISERQTDSERGGGAKSIEVFVDSMKIDYRGARGSVTFNSQDPTVLHNREIVGHPAVFVPSTLVSRVAHIEVSPYGTPIGVKGAAIESLLKQADQPVVDEHTRYGITSLVGKEVLSSIYFPWRNVLPLGRKVPFNQPFQVPLTITLDRVAFTDSASATLIPSDTVGGYPRLAFTAQLRTPISEWMVIAEEQYPVKISEAEGIASGELTLDRDGVVLGGWTATSGTVKGDGGSGPVTARFSHEVYIKQVGMHK